MWNWVKVFRVKLSKHRFDLDSPTPCHSPDGGYHWESFTCKRCGLTLHLSLDIMKQLPWMLSHGCPGKQPYVKK